MQARHLSGFVSLRDMDTGEAFDVAVMVVMDPEAITYTAQSVDRERQITLHAPRRRSGLFVRMMQAVEEVASARSTA